MNFTPDNLLENYLNGTLDGESKAALDALVQKDPLFSEKVTQALSQRVDPMSEASVDRIAADLDGRIGKLWNSHKPFNVGPYLKPALGIFMWTGIAVTAGYMSLQVAHWISYQAAPPTESAVSVKGPAALPAAHYDAHRPEMETLSPKIEPVKTPKAQAHIPGPASGTQEGDSIRLSLELDGAKNVDITIVNSGGAAVRHLFNGNWTSSHHYIDWNGKNDGGSLVPPGDYTVIIEAEGKKQSGIVTIRP
jgi:hypothetical protein